VYVSSSYKRWVSCSQSLPRCAKSIKFLPTPSALPVPADSARLQIQIQLRFSMVARADGHGFSEYVLIYPPQTLISYPSADEPADIAPHRMDNIWLLIAPQRKLECGHFTGSPTDHFISFLLPACTDVSISTESTIVIFTLPVFLILRYFFTVQWIYPI
jgi:hypothetical protein